MNALQASELLERLRKKKDALERVIYYLEDDYDWRDDVATLNEVLESFRTEHDKLATRLSEVRV